MKNNSEYERCCVIFFHIWVMVIWDCGFILYDISFIHL